MSTTRNRFRQSCDAGFVGAPAGAAFRRGRHPASRGTRGGAARGRRTDRARRHAGRAAREARVAWLHALPRSRSAAAIGTVPTRRSCAGTPSARASASATIACATTGAAKGGRCGSTSSSGRAGDRCRSKIWFNVCTCPHGSSAPVPAAGSGARSRRRQSCRSCRPTGTAAWRPCSARAAARSPDRVISPSRRTPRSPPRRRPSPTRYRCWYPPNRTRPYDGPFSRRGCRGAPPPPPPPPTPQHKVVVGPTRASSTALAPPVAGGRCAISSSRRTPARRSSAARADAQRCATCSFTYGTSGAAPARGSQCRRRVAT